MAFSAPLPFPPATLPSPPRPQPPPHSSLPPSFLSNASSLFIRSLQSLKLQSPHPAFSFSSTFRPSSTDSSSLGGVGGRARSIRQDADSIEELSWTSTTVTWSLSGSSYRTYSFNTQAQPITQALFCSFPSRARASTTPRPSPASSSATTSTRPPETFSPFLPSPPPPRTDDPLAQPYDPTLVTATTPPPPPLERHLLVLLQEIAFVYPIHSGGSVPIQLPFRIYRAWAMDEGVLLERARATMEDEATLWELKGVGEELRPVMRCEKMTLGDGKDREAKVEAPLSPFADLEERIVLVSDRKDGSEPLIVFANEEKRKISVWCCAEVDHPDEGVEENEQGKGKGREPPTPTTTTTTGKRKRTSFAVSNTSTVSAGGGGSGPGNTSNNNTANVSLGDRDPRLLASGRRVSTSGGGGNPASNPGNITSSVPDSDLLEALAAGGMASSAGMKRTTSAMSALSAVDRRGSVTRNELSVTMDRMALGSGGVEGDLTLLGGGLGDEDGWESLEGGLGVGAKKRERVLSKVWEMEIGSEGSAQGGLFSTLSAHIFDSRQLSTTSRTSTLALHLGASGTLLLLSVASSTRGQLVLAPLAQFAAQSVARAVVTRPDILDLVVLPPMPSSTTEWQLLTASAHSTTLAVPTSSKPVTKLSSTGSSSIVLHHSDGTRSVTTFSSSTDSLATKCLEALALCLPIDVFAPLLATTREENGWEGLENALDGIFGLVATPPTPPTDAWSAFLAEQARTPPSNDPVLLALGLTTPRSTNATPRKTLKPTMSIEQRELIVLSLHVVAQNLKLLVKTQGDYMRLSEFVGRLVGSLPSESDGEGKRQEWRDWYRRQGIGGEERREGDEMEADIEDSSPSTLPASPPDILRALYSLLSTPSVSSYNLFSALFSLPKSSTASLYYGHPSTTSLTSSLLTLFTTLALPTSRLPTAVSRAQEVVSIMATTLGWSIENQKVERLVVGVQVPLKEAMRVCQFEPGEKWGTKECELVRRADLARRMEGGGVGKLEGTVKLRTGAPRGIEEIVRRAKEGIFTDGPEKDEGADEATMVKVPKAVRFNEDRRLEEVNRMLQYDEPVVIGGDRTLDQLTPQVQQGILLSLSNRTLALPIGHAMFTFRTKPRLASESIPVARVNTSARILPMPSPVALIEKEPRDVAGVIPSTHDRFEWPEFHSGVAAALQLEVGQAGFDSSQISFNKPAELDSRHAGFLFGLGLSGHVGAMAFNQAFEYLKVKHDPTSIGLLLGLAVTYLGTGDPKITSLLSVHLTALHPPHSSPLNVSGITQSAGLVGIGLLYLGTQKRTLADVMVRELCGIKVTAIEDPPACREAYALSAGFAFGMIMLGSGKKATSTSASGEVDLLRTFRALILGESNHPLPGAKPSPNMTDVNITSSAATMGLGLMYLKTERQDVADMLEIPDTARRLDYVRSDLLLLRTLAKSLIMWDTVQSSKAWVESHVPTFIQTALERSSKTGKPIDGDFDIARWNVVAGACFGLGLKFAGTAAAEAHGTLIHYLDRLTRAAYVKAATVQGKIKRHAIRSCLSVVAISLSMVMAGTGEINVLRRLRVAHGHFGDGVSYGTHLATHISLGLLFVGSGHHTLGTSNAAIAALVLAFYPAFPALPTENRAHLQAYRHLWTLAIEPRCLIARDVETNEPTFLPIRLRLAEKDTKELRAKQLIAPTLIPELRLIHTIQVDTPRYWGFSLSLVDNSEHLKSFLNDDTLYVKRRTGHLSYAQDPRGIRSIFTRSKSETGSSVIDFGETARVLSPSAAGLRDFVSSFSDDTDAVAAVAYLCHPSTDSDLSTRGSTPATLPTAFEAFNASVLLECLTRDKRDTVAIYQSIYSLHSQLCQTSSPSPTSLLALEQLQFLVDFYRKGPFVNLLVKSRSSRSTTGGASAPRESLVQTTFIDHVVSTLVARAQAHLAPASEAASALRSYLIDSSWPTSMDAGARLATVLKEQEVPSRKTLETLRGLVRGVVEAARDAREGEEEITTKVRLLLRGTAKAVEAGGGKVWTEEVAEVMVDAWVGV